MGDFPRIEVSGRHPLLVGNCSREEDDLDIQAAYRIVALETRESVHLPCFSEVFYLPLCVVWRRLACLYKFDNGGLAQ